MQPRSVTSSSKFSIIEAGLKCVQGKCIVNSISMKEGEDKFIEQAKICQRFGAAVIVMAFDEKGQADTKERKVEICERAYKILTEQVGYDPQDIIFDPNIFPVATGIDEHHLAPRLALIQFAVQLVKRQECAAVGELGIDWAKVRLLPCWQVVRNLRLLRDKWISLEKICWRCRLKTGRVKGYLWLSNIRWKFQG